MNNGRGSRLTSFVRGVFFLPWPWVVAFVFVLCLVELLCTTQGRTRREKKKKRRLSFHSPKYPPSMVELEEYEGIQVQNSWKDHKLSAPENAFKQLSLTSHSWLLARPCTQENWRDPCCGSIFQFGKSRRLWHWLKCSHQMNWGPYEQHITWPGKSKYPWINGTAFFVSFSLWTKLFEWNEHWPSQRGKGALDNIEIFSEWKGIIMSFPFPLENQECVDVNERVVDCRLSKRSGPKVGERNTFWMNFFLS